MLVCLIERSLSLYHAPETKIGGSLPSLFWVLVDTTHALISNIQNQANDLGCLSQESTSLNNVVMVKLSSSRVFIKLERAIDISKVVVLILQESRNHFSKVLLILL